jgi:hypothetical protein
MVETKVHIRFARADGASAAIESTAEGERRKQAEIVLFCHFAVRVLRSLANGASAASLGQSLAELEETSIAGVTRRAHETGVAEAPNVESPAEAAAAKRLLVVQRLVSARNGPRIFLSVKPRGFGIRRTGIDRALERFVYVVLASLLEQRAGDTVYARQLTRAGGSIGHLAGANPAVLANEVGAALAAADFGWQAGMGANGAAKNRVGHTLRTEHELRCPTCAASGAGAPEERLFERRLWPDTRARVARCGHCGGGIWVRDGTARAIARDAWRATESIRSWLEDEREVHDEGSLFEALKALFTGEGWSFVEIDPMPVLLTEQNGPSGTWKLYAHAVEERQLILLYSICPLIVPPDKRAEMASFLTRANYGLAVGNFELDFSDGEIRYKTSLSVEDGYVSPTLFRRLAHVNALAMQRYLPSIAAVMTGTPANPGLDEQRGD